MKVGDYLRETNPKNKGVFITKVLAVNGNTAQTKILFYSSQEGEVRINRRKMIRTTKTSIPENGIITQKTITYYGLPFSYVVIDKTKILAHLI